VIIFNDVSEEKNIMLGLRAQTGNEVNMRTKVVAVIPALNEERTIENMINKTSKYVDHVIVVDDASSDNTAKLARNTGALVLKLHKRKKVGGVVKAGLEYARNQRPNIIVTIDADGQHDPDDIPALIYPITMGEADWVMGSRFLRKGSTYHSVINRLGITFFSQIITFLTGQKITDPTCGFRALSSKVLSGLDVKFEYDCYPEMNLTLSLEGFRMVEVPIKNSARQFGSSRVVVNSLSYGFKTMGIVLYTFLRKKVLASKSEMRLK
jgi:glycosyltransferase involved in cell wall biosynthesis